VRKSGEKGRGERPRRSRKIALEGGEKLLESRSLPLEKVIQLRALAGEKPLNFGFRVLRIVSRPEYFVIEAKLIHGIETDKVEVVLRTFSGFFKDPVEQRFHHQKGGSDIELVPFHLQGAGSASEAILLFKEFNIETTTCEEKRTRHPARTTADDDDLPAITR
jgi:hypothetical protein